MKVTRKDVALTVLRALENQAERQAAGLAAFDAIDQRATQRDAILLSMVYPAQKATGL